MGSRTGSLFLFLSNMNGERYLINEEINSIGGITDIKEKYSSISVYASSPCNLQTAFPRSQRKGLLYITIPFGEEYNSTEKINELAIFLLTIYHNVEALVVFNSLKFAGDLVLHCPISCISSEEHVVIIVPNKDSPVPCHITCQCIEKNPQLEFAIMERATTIYLHPLHFSTLKDNNFFEYY